MGGEKDGVVLAEVANQVAHLPDLVGIEADGRLVEDEQVGRVQEGVGQTDPLAVALGERADDAVFHVLERAKLLHIPHAFALAGTGDLLEGGPVIEVLGYPHVGVKRDVFRHVAEVLPGLHRLAEHVEPGNGGAPGSCRHIARKNAHRRRFSSAIGPKKADDLAFFDFEAQIFNRGKARVAFRQVLDFYHVAG